MGEVMVDRGVLAALAALFGALVGSFLNVCIVRWGAEPKQSVVRPPSRCPRCGRGIAWYDNIPVLSWLLLRGRCRGCSLPISPMYPLVELANAALWATVAWRLGPTLEAAAGAVFLTILLGIACTDARAYIIPDEFTLGGMALGLAFAAAGGRDAFVAAAVGGAVGFGLLWIVGAAGTWLAGKDAMGGGDIKMLGMVGTFLGAAGAVATIFLGAFVGLLLHLVALVVARARPRPVPVAPEGRDPAAASDPQTMTPDELRHAGYIPFGISLAIAAGVILLAGLRAPIEALAHEYALLLGLGE